MPGHYTTDPDSLTSGIFPQTHKSADVKPLLKKPTLDHNNLKNFRPVSNFSFLSKIIEKIVLSQMSDHLCSNSLLNPLQSAYKPGHSTETALLKIVNDLLLSLDNGNQQRSIQLITTFYLVVLSMFFGIQVLHCNRSPPTYPTEKLSPSTTQSLILIPFRTVCLKALSLGLFCLYSIPHPSLIYCTSLDSSPLICRSHAAEKICTTTSC